MSLRGEKFVRNAALGAASVIALAFFSPMAVAADTPASPLPVDAALAAPTPTSVLDGKPGVRAMAPIPDAPSASQRRAANAPATQRSAIVIQDGVITSPQAVEASAAALFSPIDQNPSLTGTPGERPGIIVKDGVVMMAPVTGHAPSVRIATGGTAQPKGELACLATAIYFEARGESTRGQSAVAEVVLARKRAPGRPKSVCGVVYEGSDLDTGCQFSFTCDGLSDTPRDGASWTRAKRIAALALKGKLKRVTRGATYYHANYVAPSWASRMVRVATIGTHVFYRP